MPFTADLEIEAHNRCYCTLDKDVLHIFSNKARISHIKSIPLPAESMWRQARTIGFDYEMDADSHQFPRKYSGRCVAQVFFDDGPHYPGDDDADASISHPFRMTVNSDEYGDIDMDIILGDDVADQIFDVAMKLYFGHIYNK